MFWTRTASFVQIQFPKLFFVKECCYGSNSEDVYIFVEYKLTSAVSALKTLKLSQHFQVQILETVLIVTFKIPSEYPLLYLQIMTITKGTDLTLFQLIKWKVRVQPINTTGKWNFQWLSIEFSQMVQVINSKEELMCF